ncbi:Protein SERAC1 [Penicillium chrysogenum]|uniref:Pc20g13740 protein n=2 Tax=Penicillium chrysogenum species complex TaxID=254878 RepID=B6HH11_PENRW|nr:uncharacterized protein N7525_009751 [Penicillium rubens]KAJ5831498.1 hypothetical protein N7525_009751 [Penicillium rubens]KZN86429.1 Protein SERAC1 [Penicillium chrysogenum]CAP86703.1 Pc20g13740 [Penicillium rubens Wisconsin 54-1255]
MSELGHRPWFNKSSKVPRVEPPSGDHVGSKLQFSVEASEGSQNPPSAPLFPDGVEVLYECPKAAFDICFIHGLTGDRRTTWTAPKSTWTANKQPAPWPQELFPAEITTRARILTYGYDAYVLRKSVASSNRLRDHATNLLNNLTTDRASCNASSRPLIFIAHSLGGLVCKMAILLSRNNPDTHLRELFTSTKGVIFMGTPHKGSWIADWSKIPAKALGIMKSTNKGLLTVLETENQLIQSLQLDFMSMLRGSGNLKVTCFYEELPLPMVGQVVCKESATLDGYNSIGIHANHSAMVKFASKEDNGYKSLLGELQRWMDGNGTGTDEIKELTVGNSPFVFNNYGAGLINTNNGSAVQYNSFGSGNMFNGPIYGLQLPSRRPH